ncbi:MAG: colanic acid biosynthesis glycosyltransferase WcaL [Desulfobulbaceae bacterium]|nr:MAG: colanic acid biosynthesis glycosyltransferase WcaL [Desulfobulbaceae bacterium]
MEKSATRNVPPTAYILLWFPKPSETFIYNEIKQLRHVGLPITVYTLYGRIKKDLSEDMQSETDQTIRLGWTSIPRLASYFLYQFWKQPRLTFTLLCQVLLRRPKGAEKTLENLWAFFCSFYLAYLFNRENISHIHAPWASGCATAAWSASRLSSIPFSFTMRAWDVHPPDNLIEEKVSEARFIRSETRYNIDHLIGETNPYAEKCHVTRNSVPLSTSKETIPTFNTPCQLLAIGRLVGKKGFNHLIDSCATLRQMSVPYHLHLIGSGPKLNQLRSHVSQRGLESHITFHGYVPHDQIQTYYKQADILIMPCVIDSSGDRDGIPTVILEALACCVPVITTPVSGIPELIIHKHNGLLASPGNPEEIAQSVIQLIEDTALRRQIVKNGYRDVMAEFSNQTNIQKLLTLYQQYQ